jgi:hypothetical protein
VGSFNQWFPGERQKSEGAIFLFVPLVPIGRKREAATPLKARVFDPNEKGKITKQEWMKFMEAEFDRLDKD